MGFSQQSSPLPQFPSLIYFSSLGYLAHYVLSPIKIAGKFPFRSLVPNKLDQPNLATPFHTVINNCTHPTVPPTITNATATASDAWDIRLQLLLHTPPMNPMYLQSQFSIHHQHFVLTYFLCTCGHHISTEIKTAWKAQECVISVQRGPLYNMGGAVKSKHSVITRLQCICIFLFVTFCQNSVPTATNQIKSTQSTGKQVNMHWYQWVFAGLWPAINGNDNSLSNHQIHLLLLNAYLWYASLRRNEQVTSASLQHTATKQVFYNPIMHEDSWHVTRIWQF